MEKNAGNPERPVGGTPAEVGRVVFWLEVSVGD